MPVIWWELAVRCLAFFREKRPSMEHILDVLTVYKSKRPLTVKEAKSQSNDLRALFRAKALHGCE
jgi:hypothetical protein